MANTDKCCIQILPLLVCFLFLSNVVTAYFKQIEHPITHNTSTLNFLALGDWGRQGMFNQSLVAQRMGEVGEKLGIDMVVSTGDNFYKDGLIGENDPAFTQSFTNIYTARSLQKPWYTILGNHDYHGDSMAQLSPVLKRRDNRWNCHRSYVVRAGMLDIFFIDTNPFINEYFIKTPKTNFNWTGVLPRNQYLSTLLKNLKIGLRTSTATWKIVVGHHPIRTIGKRGDTVELQNTILPILGANKVPIYINGHDHCLEHINNTGVPIEFLTSGGGSKAWYNTFNKDGHKNNLKFYHDGQGFISVQLSRTEANANKVPIYINGHDHCLEHINNTGVPIELVTSGGGSKAWGNTFNKDSHKKNLKFYHDGQGFVSVQLSRIQENVTFHDVYGTNVHSFVLKKSAN